MSYEEQKKMLYTGKGDSGETSIFGSCERLSKASPVIEALGALDEINSLLGVCKMRAASNGDGEMSKLVGDAQQSLFVVQAEVAGAPKELSEHKVAEMEEKIGAIERQLPPITTFFVAGGTELSAMFDYARAVSRRAERRLIAYKDFGGSISPASLRYANRLSSLLYALSRVANVKSEVAEEKPTYR
jgi:cob(I)alamin adenosyltransferase